MPTLPTVMHQLRAVLPGPAELSDAQLLTCFLARRDEAAFETLVRRHGPMVLGVCRRRLPRDEDAEDAFQATFLVLVRKAHSIVPRANVANWLYGVAHRTALKASMLMSKRTEQARRLRAAVAQNGEAQSGEATADQEALWHDVLPLLDLELTCLPDRYRTAIVLCDLEGKTRKEVARQLNVPEGTVAGWLSRGRVLLARRLKHRGVTVAGGALAGVLATRAAAHCGTGLVHATVRSAVAYCTSAALPTNIATLTQGVLRTMLISKLKTATAVLLAVGLVAVGAGWLGCQALADDSALVPQQPAAAVAASVAPVIQPAQPTQPPAAKGTLNDEVPAGATARLGSTRLRHGDTVFFIAYTAKGKQLVTAGHDQTVRLWDAATGRELRRFEWPAPPKGGPGDKALLDEIEKALKDQNIAVDAKAIMRLFTDGALTQPFPVAVSADGSLVAAQKAGVIAVWETATGKRLHELRPKVIPQLDGAMLMQIGALGAGGELTFSPDNKELWVVTGDGVQTYDLATGKQGKLANTGGNTFIGGGSSVLSPDGKFLASEVLDLQQQSSVLRVRDLKAGKTVAEYKTNLGGFRGLGFSPDGKTLAWCDFMAGLQVVEVGKDREPRTIGQAQLDDQPSTFAFAPDGKTIATAHADRTVRLWDVTTGKELAKLGEPAARPATAFGVLVDVNAAGARPADVAFSPDGKTVAASLGGPHVRQFDVAAGKEIALPEAGHRAAVTAVRIAPDGKTALTAAPGDGVSAWDLATGKRLNLLKLPDALAVALSADGKRAAGIAGKTVTLWDVARNEKLKQFDVGQLGLTAVALSPDGSLIAVREAESGRVSLWDSSGRELGGFSDEGMDPAGDMIQVVEVGGLLTPELAFSPDGRTLAGADGKRRLCLWDVSTRGIRWQVELPGNKSAAHFALAPTGRTVAVQYDDGTVALYESSTGAKRGQFGKADPNRATGGVAFAFGGRLFDLLDPTRITADTLAFSPDGRHLALAAGSPVVQLWDVYAAKEVGQLKGHQGGVTCVVFAPDGKTVVTGSLDTTSLVWDVSAAVKPAAPASEPLDAETLKRLWAELRGNDAAKAFDALRVLREHPAQTLALARADVKAVPPPDVKEIRRLVDLLNSPKFAERQKAAADLEKLGDVILPELAKALEGQPSLEVKQRIDVLRKRLTRIAPDAALVRDLRVLELAELQGGPEARQFLTTVAEGAPGAALTQEAAAALRRMGK
jgi:RNA polymerase sigma factor (sigma-70 family)